MSQKLLSENETLRKDNNDLHAKLTAAQSRVVELEKQRRDYLRDFNRVVYNASKDIVRQFEACSDSKIQLQLNTARLTADNVRLRELLRECLPMVGNNLTARIKAAIERGE